MPKLIPFINSLSDNKIKTYLYYYSIYTPELIRDDIVILFKFIHYSHTYAVFYPKKEITINLPQKIKQFVLEELISHLDIFIHGIGAERSWNEYKLYLSTQKLLIDDYFNTLAVRDNTIHLFYNMVEQKLFYVDYFVRYGLIQNTKVFFSEPKFNSVPKGYFIKFPFSSSDSSRCRSYNLSNIHTSCYKKDGYILQKYNPFHFHEIRCIMIDGKFYIAKYSNVFYTDNKTFLFNTDKPQELRDQSRSLWFKYRKDIMHLCKKGYLLSNKFNNLWAMKLGLIIKAFIEIINVLSKTDFKPEDIYTSKIDKTIKDLFDDYKSDIPIKIAITSVAIYYKLDFLKYSKKKYPEIKSDVDKLINLILMDFLTFENKMSKYKDKINQNNLFSVAIDISLPDGDVYKKPFIMEQTPTFTAGMFLGQNYKLKKYMIEHMGKGYSEILKKMFETSFNDIDRQISDNIITDKNIYSTLIENSNFLTENQKSFLLE